MEGGRGGREGGEGGREGGREGEREREREREKESMSTLYMYYCLNVQDVLHVRVS